MECMNFFFFDSCLFMMESPVQNQQQKHEIFVLNSEIKNWQFS